MTTINTNRPNLQIAQNPANATGQAKLETPAQRAAGHRAFADSVIGELRNPGSTRGFEMLKSEEFKNLPAAEQDRIVRTAIADTALLDLNNTDDRARAAALFSSLMVPMSDIDGGGLKLSPEVMGALITFAEELSTAIPDGGSMQGVLVSTQSRPDPYSQRLAKHISVVTSASPADQLSAIRDAIKLMHGADAAQSDVEDASQRPPLNDGMVLPTGTGLEAMLISFLGQIEEEHKGQLDGLLAGGDLTQTMLAQSKMALDKLSAQMDMALGVLSDIGDLEKKKGRIFQA